MNYTIMDKISSTYVKKLALKSMLPITNRLLLVGLVSIDI